MRTKVERLAVDWGMEQATLGYNLNIAYHPISDRGMLESFCGTVTMGEVSDDAKREFPELANEEGLSGERKKLYDRAVMVGQLLNASVAEEFAVEVDESVVRFPMRLETFTVKPDEGMVHLRLESGTDLKGPEIDRIRMIDMLPAGLRRLMAGITTTAERMAWEDFRRQLKMEPRPSKGATGPQVFISYRKSHERFAEALALRLGAEGMVPWFDKWDVLAGDSLPGKIEEGLRNSIAFIPIITADYQSGKWATEELESAIAKRIETDFKIIPVLLEPCEKPELIRHLRYVDFTSQDPDTFEAKVAELIDGIYSLTLNPFRR